MRMDDTFLGEMGMTRDLANSRPHVEMNIGPVSPRRGKAFRQFREKDAFDGGRPVQKQIAIDDRPAIYEINLRRRALGNGNGAETVVFRSVSFGVGGKGVSMLGGREQSPHALVDDAVISAAPHRVPEFEIGNRIEAVDGDARCRRVDDFGCECGPCHGRRRAQQDHDEKSGGQPLKLADGHHGLSNA